MEVAAKLRAETGKWLRRIKQERRNVQLLDPEKKDFLKNIDAYIADCEHFLKKEDVVLAFESVIWAWAWLSIGKELGILTAAE